MSLMLFFSHCSLRQTLEETLDLNNASVSHKRNIQEPQSADCYSFNAENATLTKVSFQLDHDQIIDSGIQDDISINKTDLNDLPVRKSPQGKSFLKTVPLYILYQNMKYFIS